MYITLYAVVYSCSMRLCYLIIVSIVISLHIRTCYSSKMSSKINRIVCASAPLFEDALSTAVTLSNDSAKPLFILFTGKVNEATGKSWCPDCVNADPVIEESLSKLATGCNLLVCIVDREEYRQPTYPYRVNSSINLKCVPTLHKWGKRGSIGSLNDSQSQQQMLVDELVEM